MAKYLVTKKTYLTTSGSDGPRLFKPGDKVNYDGVPGKALEPIDAAAKSAKAERDPEYAEDAREAKPERRSGPARNASKKGPVKSSGRGFDDNDRSPPQSPSLAGGKAQTKPGFKPENDED